MDGGQVLAVGYRVRVVSGCCIHSSMLQSRAFVLVRLHFANCVADILSRPTNHSLNKKCIYCKHLPAHLRRLVCPWQTLQ